MMKFSDTIQKLVDMSLLPIKYLQFLMTKLGNIISDLTDFSSEYTTEENIQKLRSELGGLEREEHIRNNIPTKIELVRNSLYRNILSSNKKFSKEKETILRKYYKIAPYIFDLGSREELSLETFNAKEVARIMVELLYLKKDELDKVDGGLPVI